MPKNQQLPRMKDTESLGGYYGPEYNADIGYMTSDDGRPINAIDDEAPPAIGNDTRSNLNGSPKGFRRTTSKSY